MKNLILIIVFLILCPSLVLAEEKPIPNFKVSIQIDINDDDTNQTIVSYISRELRSLGDVTIVDTGEDCLLQVVVIEIENKASTDAKLGFALSVAYLEPTDAKVFLSVLNGLADLHTLVVSYPYTEQINEVVDRLSALVLKMNESTHTLGDYSIDQHLLYVGGSDDLRNRCEKIIVDFDNNYLKEKRVIKVIMYGGEAPTKP